jgi:uncharacterized membrane protein YbhN (UPF0104 family)
VGELDPLPDRNRKLRSRVVLALKLGISALLFAYLGSLARGPALAAAFGRATALHFALSFGLALCAISVGAARWGWLLMAYAAPTRPPFFRLLRLYLIGFFYNLLPGAVGGDVIRGVATRESFGDKGSTAAVAVVFVERVLGLTALLVITATMALLRPAQGVERVLPWSLVGLGIAACAVGTISLAHRIAPRLPGVLGRFAARLPAIASPGSFVIALLLSFGTQTLVALGAHVILAEIAPQVTLADSLALVPLASAAAFFPLTPGGTGAREGAFVALFAAIGVAPEDALAASLVILGVNLCLALVGGVLQLITPRSPTR